VTGALASGRDGEVLDKVIALAGKGDDEAEDTVALLQDIDLPRRDQRPVVGQHRRRRAIHARQIEFISQARDLLKAAGIFGPRRPQPLVDLAHA
jgi:hypothetical protein